MEMAKARYILGPASVRNINLIFSQVSSATFPDLLSTVYRDYF